MADRVVMRTGEALVEGDLDYLCAEPEIAFQICTLLLVLGSMMDA